jgi:hypothetical protein
MGAPTDEDAERIAEAAHADVFRLRLPVRKLSIHAHRHAFADDEIGRLFMDQLSNLIGSGKVVATIDMDGRPFRAVTTFTVSGHRELDERRLILWLSPATTSTD